MVESRFLQLADVAEILNVSSNQVYALVRSGALPAIKVGGRGQWRVERDKLDEYIAAAYVETEAWVRAHPLGSIPDDDAEPDDDADDRTDAL